MGVFYLTVLVRYLKFLFGASSFRAEASDIFLHFCKLGLILNQLLIHLFQLQVKPSKFIFLHFCKLGLILNQLLIHLFQLQVKPSKFILLLNDVIPNSFLQGRNLGSYLFFQILVPQIPVVYYLTVGIS